MAGMVITQALSLFFVKRWKAGSCLGMTLDEIHMTLYVMEEILFGPWSSSKMLRNWGGGIDYDEILKSKLKL